jgi:NADH:ubiquinone reductase (H+-translocating)
MRRKWVSPMPQIVIVGGGFAGVWSAAAAMRQHRRFGSAAADLQVTVIEPQDHLVIRPRLYESDPGRMRIPLDRLLGPIGVAHLRAAVTAIDTTAHTVALRPRTGPPAHLDYDRLVLAAGSRLTTPRLPGAEHLFDVDTLPAATALHEHLQTLVDTPDTGPTAHSDKGNTAHTAHVGNRGGRFTVVVIGAGFTGLELACELVDRLHAVADPVGAGAEVRVVLVDRAHTLGPELGPGPRPHIQAALDELGIEVRLGVAPVAVTPAGVRLDDGTALAARTVVWTAGMVAHTLTAQIPGRRDRLGRLRVDPFLRVVGVPDVYAAGDTAAARTPDGHPVLQSCQHAIPLGKTAGHNAAADLLDRPLTAFASTPYVTCVDLGVAGAVFTTGFERAVCRTGAAAKDAKRAINTELIYPPVDDAHALLEQAEIPPSGDQPAVAPAA